MHKNVHMPQTVRINPAAHTTLTEIARDQHLSLTDALTEAVEAYKRQIFFARMREDYEALKRDDPEGWAEEQAEVALWDTTSADGLENE